MRTLRSRVRKTSVRNRRQIRFLKGRYSVPGNSERYGIEIIRKLTMKNLCRFGLAVLALAAVTAGGEAVSGEEESSGEQFYYQPACLKEKLKAGTAGTPGLRDFLQAFADKWKSPGVQDYLKNSSEPDSSYWVKYPSERAEDEVPPFGEVFSARSYRHADHSHFFAMLISTVDEEMRETASFCYYRFDGKTREFVPAVLFDSRNDNFISVDNAYLISENGDIVRSAGFLYDESEFPLYALEQQYVWKSGSFDPRPPVLISPVKLLSPASPDGKWDRLSLTDIDGDGIPEIFLSRSDTGAQDVFFGNGAMGRLSGISAVPASFRVSGNGIAVSDASGLNVSYTEIKDSTPGRMLTLSCRNDSSAKNGKACRSLLDGREVSEEKAAMFIAGLAVSRELRPDYSAIREVQTAGNDGGGAD